MPGYYQKVIRIKPNADPVDNVTKFAYADEDYETVEEWYEYTEEELAIINAAEEEANRKTQIEVALSMSIMAMNLADDQALSVSTLYPEWIVGIQYKTGDIRRYNGSLYRALQDSTAEEQYTPDIFVAGWKAIGEPEGGIFPWSQPLGATDAYKFGDKVSHDGKTWESTIANNVWEPGVCGWKEVEDSGQTEPTDPDEPVEGEYPEWVQPTGAHDAYSIGDKVTHNGRHWVSIVDNNVWEPGAYGWEESE